MRWKECLTALGDISTPLPSKLLSVSSLVILGLQRTARLLRSSRILLGISTHVILVHAQLYQKILTPSFSNKHYSWLKTRLVIAYDQTVIAPIIT